MTNAGRVLLIPKGDYNAATTYTMLDVVYYEGRSYVCKQTSSGNLPTNTTYWQAMTGADADKMNATNPTGTGSFSLNRKANTTVGNYSFAEGTDCTASGYGSHAEGLGVTASGVGSHAEGNYTIAGYNFQHVCGQNNDNKAATLFEVGNGAFPEEPSNAFEVYSDGTLSTDNGTTKVKLETLVSQSQALTNYVTDTGVKNLLPYPWTGEKDEQGITYTVSNEVLSANGTNTSNSYYRFRAKTDTPFLANGDYIFSVDLTGTYPADATLEVITRTSPDASPSHNYNTVLGTGNHVEVPFSINNDNYIVVQIYNGAGKTYTNATIKPMIRLASITDSTYQPYAKTNVELTQAVPKESVITYNNISNDEASKYYVKLSGSLLDVLGATKILSATVADFSGDWYLHTDKVLPNIAVSNTDNCPYLTFKYNSTFSGVNMAVRYTYI